MVLVISELSLFYLFFTLDHHFASPCATGLLAGQFYAAGAPGVSQDMARCTHLLELQDAASSQLLKSSNMVDICTMFLLAKSGRQKIANAEMRPWKVIGQHHEIGLLLVPPRVVAVLELT